MTVFPESGSRIARERREAAAKALWEWEDDGPWEMGAEPSQDEYRALAQRLLAAADGWGRELDREAELLYYRSSLYLEVLRSWEDLGADHRDHFRKRVLDRASAPVENPK